VIGPPETVIPADGAVKFTLVTVPVVNVCQVLSQRKNVVASVVPEPNLAAATVPEDILEPLRVVKPKPLPVAVP
jgi:hypothetical protein